MLAGTASLSRLSSSWCWTFFNLLFPYPGIVFLKSKSKSKSKCSTAASTIWSEGRGRGLLKINSERRETESVAEQQRPFKVKSRNASEFRDDSRRQGREEEKKAHTKADDIHMFLDTLFSQFNLELWIEILFSAGNRTSVRQCIALFSFKWDVQLWVFGSVFWNSPHCLVKHPPKKILQKRF
jgi:hypothetical protein